MGSTSVTDIDSTFYVVMVYGSPAYGWASGWQSTNLLYDPAPNFVGTDEFTYIAADYEWSLPARVTVIVTNVNDPPVTEHQSFATQEDTPITFTLAATDVDGDPLAVIITVPPWTGTVTNTGLTVTYTPDPNFYGLVSFEFRISDGQTTSGWRYADILVEPVNDAPIADDKTAVLDEDGPIAIMLTGADVDNTELSFSIVTPPEHGEFVDGIYTPSANYNGTDSFTYKANDGQLDSAPATVSITINPVNDAPVADGKSAVVNEDGSVAVALTGSDVEGSALTFAVVDAPAHGNFVNGTYSPGANYHGPDSFTYKANDGQADSALATVSITVTPVNDFPAADSKSISTAEDQNVAVALTGSDIDGDTLSFSVVDAPAYGTFANGVYTPAVNYNGADIFTYKANDGQADSALATVTVTIIAVNDAPVANVQSVSTAYNTAVNITLAGTDVEGSAITFTTLSSPANGTFSGAGANRTFTPNIGWSGTTSFTFKVNDGALDSATATVMITVAAPTGIPTAPSALTATAVSQNQINLSWTDNSNNEDGFKIERSPNGNSGWTQIATVGPNVTTFSNTGLTKNTRYHYRVRAYNVLGNSAYSNTANARTFN